MRSRSHEQRITALETRVEENDRTCNETHYKLVRRCARLDVNMTKILHHFKLVPASEDEVDEVLDAE